MQATTVNNYDKQILDEIEKQKSTYNFNSMMAIKNVNDQYNQ